MKLNLRHFNKARVGYLYPDGHFVLIHDKKDKDAGTVEWKTVFKTIGVDVSIPEGEGYLVLDREFLPFLIHLKRIHVGKAGVEHGSTNTINKDISIQNVTLWTKGSEHGFIFTTFPGLLISGVRHTNIGHTKTFEEDKKEYHINVKKVYE